ncbi:hypothetical protein M9H77_28076 [Catharanthus roseus]|uniref:Uncharacterized protein n=1 Tax=Catharanthus roseus TaxID=4058 RepID=A0ACC0AH11_CATRO|nr:hypothetical protein M9H77_28076 [Catharanthus roseus]
MSFSLLSLGSSGGWLLGTRNGRSKACISQEKYYQRKNKGSITDTITIEKSNKAVEVDNNYEVPPLISALKAEAQKDCASFTFPGHNRGYAAPSFLKDLIGEKPFLYDFSPFQEIGNLSDPKGPISEAQEEAAQLFGASKTWFLVGGTTCGIQAAIMATCSPGDVLILPRNAHFSTISAMVMCGAIPKYIMPYYDSNWDIPGGVTPSQVEKAIKELETEGRKAAAVFIVSPTYHGICSDLASISQICHSRNIPLIVDEAHGAHFKFHHQLPNSALHQGADLSIQSTHKVLSSLSQSSMLHYMSRDNLIDRYKICKCLQTLQSSSPSYLLLASLDSSRAQLSEIGEITLNRAIGLSNEARNLINNIPKISMLELAEEFLQFPAMDPLRITINTRQLGISGFEAHDLLNREFGIVAELVGTRSITLVFNFGTQKEHILRLISGFEHLSRISSTKSCMLEEYGNGFEELRLFENIRMSMSPRDAFFAGKTKVSIEKSVGEICGEVVCPFPPGVPVLIPGEIITEKALDYLLKIKENGGVISGASDHLLSSLLVCIS